MVKNQETEQQKALYFDMSVKKLKKYFSDTNPNGGYGKIRDYLMQRDFTHEQYSGYHTRYKTTDLDIFDLVLDMSRELEWLPSCLNHFEVTNVGMHHNLLLLFEERFSKAV